jgi:hypothetical protein
MTKTEPVQPGMTLTLSMNEWSAIVHALGYTGSTYSREHGGVLLHDLREMIWSTAVERRQEAGA